MSQYLQVRPTATGDSDVFDAISRRKLGALAAAFHGYRRNKSIGWALLWGALGFALPLGTNVIALAQGYADPK